MIRLRKHGFTLVELMIVVAIIGVLAVVAGTAYRRYMDSGRTAEAMAMLGEIRAKEEAYRAEYSAYTGWSGGGEAEANTLPIVDSQPCAASGGKEPCAKALYPVVTGTSWTIWANLGINPGRSQLTCGYALSSGTATQAPTGTLAVNFLGSAATGTPWWSAVAICDNDGAGAPNANFATASNTSSVFTQNEHK